MNQALLNLPNVLGDLTDLNKKKNGLSYWFTTILYLRPIFIIIQKWVDFFSPSFFCFFSTCKIDIRSFFLILRHFKHVWWSIDLKVFLRKCLQILATCHYRRHYILVTWVNQKKKNFITHFSDGTKI